MLTAKIDNAAATGNVTLVAAKAGYIIYVHNYFISGAGTVTCKFQSNATTDLTGPISLIVGYNACSSQSPDDIEPYAAVFQTAAGESLTFNTSGAAVQIGGHLSYSYVATST